MNDTPLIWAEIDLGAIAHNVRELRRLTRPQARVMAVVKANGYGHGALEVARTALASGAEWLGVARLAEGIHLRKNGLDAPILVFGPTLPADAGLLVDFDLRQSITSLDAARACSAAACAQGRRIKAHLKLDTGMGRLGLVPAALSGSSLPDAAGAGLIREATAIATLPGIEAEGVFTHFAAADSADLSSAKRQLEIFCDVLERLRSAGLEFPVRHAANSAGVIALPDAHLDLVRPGIAVYGLNPSDAIDLQGIDLRPAMTLKARLIQVKRVPAGFSVSYGMTHRTPQPTTIATVPAGYADGVNRALSNRGQMLVRGQRVPIVGRVCMDLTLLDVGAVQDVQVGDEALIFGSRGQAGIPADEVAHALGTINYEIVCAVSGRVPRLYRR
jgi:alanine racemase